MRNKKTKTSPIGGNDAEGTGGFFQMNWGRLIEIARDPALGPDAVLVYTVAAGGVNSFRKEPRACTHGMNAIRSRTTMSSGSIISAIDALTSRNFFEPAPVAVADNQLAADQSVGAMGNMVLNEPNKSKLTHIFPIQLLVDPSATCDLTVSMQFLKPAKPVAEEKEGCRGETGSLLNLCEQIKPFKSANGYMSARDGVLDALLVFFALHKVQNFGTCAGIDPRVLHARFDPIDDDEIMDGSRHQVPVKGVNDWTLVSMRRPGQVNRFKEGFVHEVLGGLREQLGGHTLEGRFRQALKNLFDNGLLYTAHVLWDSDPLACGTGQYAQPLYTQYVDCGWAIEREKSLQKRINETVQETGTISGASTYGQSRGKEANYVPSGIFRYLVPNTLLKSATLLLQYRVRWWANDEDNGVGFAEDQRRTSFWTAELDDLVRKSMGDLTLDDDDQD